MGVPNVCMFKSEVKSYLLPCINYQKFLSTLNNGIHMYPVRVGAVPMYINFIHVFDDLRHHDQTLDDQISWCCGCPPPPPPLAKNGAVTI